MKKKIKKELNDWIMLPELTMEEFKIKGIWKSNFTPTATHEVKKRKK